MSASRAQSRGLLRRRVMLDCAKSVRRRQSSEPGASVAESLDARAETVLRGYLAGRFPMPDLTGRLRWQFPPRRGVIPIDGFHVPRSVARVVRSGRFEVRYDTAAEHVIRACAD